jgi:nicotinate-nucleotide adenylyltransferase
MQEIVLYFGSFNPIHHGHLIIASHVLNETEANKVWFVLSPQNPLKKAAALLNEYHRLHLLRLAIENDHRRFSVSDIEFKLPKPSYTIDTLTYLEEQYPDKKFSILMGSDSYSNIHKWKNHTLLIEKYKIYVYKRPGAALPTTVSKQTTILNAPLLDISSTHIRKLIEQRKNIQYLVPQIVAEEIESQLYYYKTSGKDKTNN